MKVELYKGDGTYFGSRMTNSAGYYSFHGLVSGAYKLLFKGDAAHIREWYDNEQDQAASDTILMEAGNIIQIDSVLEYGAGSITGQVSTEPNAGSYTECHIRLYRQSDGVQTDSIMMTGATFSYSFTGVAPGDYQVFFDPVYQMTSVYNYCEKWYNDRYGADDAETVAVTAFNITANIDTVLRREAVITGVVTEDGTNTPLSNCEVKAYKSDGTYLKTAVTDEAGGYVIPALAVPTNPYPWNIMYPEKYKLCFNPNDGTHVSEWYNDKPLSSEATIVSISTPEIYANGNASLAVGGTINGTITEEGTGEPLVNTQVKAYRYSSYTNTEVATVNTGSSGGYSILLPAGNYKLYFPGDSAHVGEFYSDKTLIDSADLIQVVQGQTNYANAALKPGGIVSGRVTGSDSGNPSLSSVFVHAYSSVDGRRYTAITNSSGDYSVVVPVGECRIQFNGNKNHLAEYYNDKGSLDNADIVSVSYSSVTQINAVLAEAYGYISGTVSGSESGNPVLENIQVTVYNSSNTEIGSGATDASGNYEVGNLPTGSYKVYFAGNANYLAEYYQDKGSLASATLVYVTIPTASDVDAVLTKNVGTISGTTSAQAGGTISECHVWVHNAITGTSYCEVTTDETGDYTVSNVPSGDYKIWFTKAGFVSEWYEDQASQESANTVTVTAGGIVTASATLTEQYDITASAGEGGSISPSGTVSIDYGASQSFSITPAANYHIADVEVDNVSQGAIASYEFTNVTAPHTIEASFAVDTNDITASAGEGGSISPSGTVSIDYGASQSFSITPAANYHIADVEVDNVSQGAIASYEFTNVTAPHTIEASFAVDTNDITASAGEGGSISPSGTVSIDYGASQSFSITPAANYHIADVEVDNVSRGAIASYEFTNVTAPHTIEASFAVDTNDITASAGEGGSISPSGTVSIDYGAEPVLQHHPRRQLPYSRRRGG